jgi:K+-transporting ATPase KdpF subunit
LRQGLIGATFMLIVTMVVTVFLFGYLLVALLRPEWF